MKIKEKMISVILALLICLMAGCGTDPVIWSSEDAKPESAGTEESEEEKQTAMAEEEPAQQGESAGETPATILIYICGAVASPGVYELPASARVIQAIQAAGGLLADADPFYVNQAKKLEDGEQIRILTREEAEEGRTSQTGLKTNSGDTKININTADEQTLMTLPGIGQSRAEAIISYRESEGGFESTEDIMKIPGIKNAVFSRIQDKISVK